MMPPSFSPTERPSGSRLGRAIRHRFVGREVPVDPLPKPDDRTPADWEVIEYWRAGPVALRIRADSGKAMREVAEVLGDLATPISPVAGAHDLALLRVETDGPSDMLAYLDGDLVVTASSSPQAAQALMVVLARLATDAEPGAVHLHAALVELDSEAMLVVGPRGSGKSTLAAAAALAGATVHTDELVSLWSDRLAVTGFPRPITLRHDMVAALALPDRSPAPGVVPLNLLGPRATGEALTPTALVFPTRDDDAPMVQPIEPHAAMARLVLEVLDVGRDLDAVAALAATVPAWQIAPKVPDDGPRLLLEVAEAVAATPVAAKRARGAAGTGDLTTALQRGEARGYGFSTGGVLLGATGVVVQLDPVGFEYWRQAHGRAPVDTVVGDLEVDPAPFQSLSAELRALHLL